MASRQPSLEEFIADPSKYPDYVMILDDAGKLQVEMTAKARRRQDRNVFSGIYKPGSGGFFCWITFFSFNLHFLYCSSRKTSLTTKLQGPKFQDGVNFLRSSAAEPLYFDPMTGKLHARCPAPSHEEFMQNPDQYPDFELIVDSAGKFKVINKVEAKRRNDVQIVT